MTPAAVPGAECWAVIVGAGDGTRLGADRPKAFVELDGRPLIAWSIEVFDAHPAIDGIVCVVPPGLEERASLLVDDLGVDRVAATVPGGATRSASVAAGLACIPDGVAHVLVHDAARPYVSSGVIDRVLAALRGGADGAVPALPVVDTIKRVSPAGAIGETLDRATLVTVQTPQGFAAAVLRAATAAGQEATDCSTLVATDCSTLVERAGGRVVTVDGDPDNYKITTAADLTRARGE